MYILNTQQQNALLQEMTMLRKDDQTLEAYYQQTDPEVMWKTFFPKANGQDRGPKIMRTEPVPKSIDVWLMECLNHDDYENARGLGIELSAKPERWPELMEVIEQNYRKYGKKQLSLFFSNLRITDFNSLFRELNIDFNNLPFDEDKMNKMARRSKIIRFKRFWFF